MTMTSVNGSRQVKTWKGYCKNKGHTFWRYSSHQRTSNRHLDEKFSVVLSNLYVYHATPLLPHLAQMCLAEYTARLREVRQRQVLQLRIFQRPPFTLPQMILHTNSHRRLYIRSLHTLTITDCTCENNHTCKQPQTTKPLPNQQHRRTNNIIHRTVSAGERTEYIG